jgi:hypothetical protein
MLIKAQVSADSNLTITLCQAISANWLFIRFRERQGNEYTTMLAMFNH